MEYASPQPWMPSSVSTLISPRLRPLNSPMKVLIAVIFILVSFPLRKSWLGDNYSLFSRRAGCR